MGQNRAIQFGTLGFSFIVIVGSFRVLLLEDFWFSVGTVLLLEELLFSVGTFYCWEI